MLSKDDFKEELFGLTRPAELGRAAWSRRLSDAAWDSLFLNAAGMSAALIEGNLPRARATDVLALHPAPVEVFCHAPLAVLLERLESRDRHPQHADHSVIAGVRAGTARGMEPLALGPVIEVDTTQDVPLADVLASLSPPSLG